MEEIAAVMDGRQNFLAEKHTIKYLRSGEILRSELAFRDTWSQWEDKGQPKLVEWAHSKAAGILTKHEVSPLSDLQISAMMEIIQTF